MKAYMSLKERREFARRTTKAVKRCLEDIGRGLRPGNWGPPKIYNDQLTNYGRSIKIVGLDYGSSKNTLHAIARKLTREYGLSATVPTPKMGAWRIHVAPPSDMKAEKVPPATKTAPLDTRHSPSRTYVRNLVLESLAVCGYARVLLSSVPVQLPPGVLTVIHPSEWLLYVDLEEYAEEEGVVIERRMPGMKLNGSYSPNLRVYRLVPQHGESTDDRKPA